MIFYFLGPYPEPHFYGVDHKREKERMQFFQWYDKVKDQTFDFEKELIEYCINDVDILARACLTFQQDFLNITGNVEYHMCHNGYLQDKVPTSRG